MSFRMQVRSRRLFALLAAVALPLLAAVVLLRASRQGSAPAIAPVTPGPPDAFESIPRPIDLRPAQSPSVARAARQSEAGVSPLNQRSLTVSGSARRLDGHPARAFVEVRGIGSVALPSVRTLSGVDGEFRLVTQIPMNCKEILVLAQGTAVSPADVAYPVRVLVGDRQEVRAIVVIRGGAVIYGRVEQTPDHPTENPTRVLVTETPLRAEEGSFGWNRFGLECIDRFLVVTATGEFRTAVRPGHVVVRVASPQGVLGPAVERFVSASSTEDLGNLLLPGEAFDQVVRVTDEGGRALPGAWVQVSDRGLYAVAENGIAEESHFVTGADGTVVIRGIASASSPVAIAASAPGFAVAEARSSAVGVPLNLRLAPLEPVRIHLVGPGADALSAADLDGASVRLMEISPPELARHQVPSPREVLLEVTRRTRFGVADPELRVLWVDRPTRSGEYRVSVVIGLSELASGTVLLPPIGPPEEEYSLQVSDGRLIEVSFRLPSGIPTEFRKLLRLSLEPTQGSPGLRLTLQADQLFSGSTHVLRVWVPSGYQQLRLTSLNATLLPIEDLVVRLGADRKYDATVKLRPDAGILEVDVLDSGGQLVGDQWPLIFVAPTGRAGDRSGAGALTDSAGRIRLHVGGGRQVEVRTDTSFVTPFAYCRSKTVPMEVSRASLYIVPQTAR